MDKTSGSKREEEAEVPPQVSGYSDFLGHESVSDGLQRGTTLTNSFTLDSWLNIPRNKISNESEEVYELPIARAKVETTINPEVPATLRISTAEQQLNSLLSVENMMNTLNMDSSSYNGSPYITAEEDNDDLLEGGTFGDLNSANLNVDDINSLLGDESNAFQQGDHIDQNYYAVPPAPLQQQQQQQQQQALYQVDPSQLYSHNIPFQETINNDSNVNSNANNGLVYFQIPKLSQTTSTNVMPLTPQIIVSPEDQARKTPSLFSSRESSRSRSNSQAAQLNLPYLGVDDAAAIVADGNIVDPQSANVLNVPNSNYDTMRRGRQRRHSQSSRETHSRSQSVASQPPSDYDDEYFSGLSSGYEDNLEEDYEDDNNISHNNSARYVCDICQKEFNRPYNLKSHQRTHTKERPFACKKCGKTFARQHDRKRHEDLHSGQKRFQCKGLLNNGQWGCGKRFARPDALRRHFFTESGKNCIKECVIESIGVGAGTQWETSGVKAAMVNATQYQRSILPSSK